MGLVFEAFAGGSARFEDPPSLVEFVGEDLKVSTGGRRFAPPAKAALSHPHYVLGRLLVKLDSANASRARRSRSHAAFGIAELDAIAGRYGVRSVTAPLEGRDTRRARARASDPRRRRAPAGAVSPTFDSVYLIELSPTLDLEVVAQEFERAGGVVWAEPVRKAEVSYLPNDPYLVSSGSWGQDYGDLWGHALIDAQTAWDTSTGDGVVVAVIDTGVDFGHPELAARAWTNPGEIPGNEIDDDGNGYTDDTVGWDFVHEQDSDPFDDHGHGTHVAGTVAAEGDNGQGMAGVAYGSRIMAVKGLNASGSAESTWLAEAILYAVDNGADVINASWGGFGSSELIDDAVDAAHAAGVVFVAAAGNSAFDARFFFPASNPRAITVSAFDSTDTVASFSNNGASIDVAAPGGGDAEPKRKYDQHRSVLSLESSGARDDMTGDGKLIVDEGYLRQAGTSMAAPHVAAVAALVLAARPTFSVEQVRQAIRVSADDVDAPGLDTNAGYGRVNAAGAVAVTSALEVTIASPSRYDVVSSATLEITGTVLGPDFESYDVDFGEGDLPSSWTPIETAVALPVADGLLVEWDLAAIDDGRYTIRLRGRTTGGAVFEDRSAVDIDRVVVTEPTVDSIHHGGGVPLSILGTAYTPGFVNFTVEWRAIEPDLSEGPWRTDGIALAGDGDAPVFAATLATFDTGVLTVGRDVDFRLTAYGDGDPVAEVFFHVVIDPDLRPGWPARIPGLPEFISFFRMQGHPTVADLDGNGSKEVLAGYGDLVFVFDHDGSDYPGWPQSVFDEDPEFYITTRAAPAVANLDGDPEMEIVSSNGKSVYAWNHDGTPLDGFPRVVTFDEDADVRGASLGDVALADIDEDGVTDIVVAHRSGLAVLHADGSDHEGWPILVRGSSGNPINVETVFAIGDATGDGSPDIAIVEAAGRSYPQSLHLIDAAGNEHPNFPLRATKKVGFANNWPVLVDLDGDGVLDIAANTDKVNKLATYSGAGERIRLRGKIPKYRRQIPGAGAFGSTQEYLTAGDIDGDGDNEIVVSTEFQSFKTRCGRNYCRTRFVLGPKDGSAFVQIVDGREKTLPGWPLELAYTQSDNAHGPGSAAIADLDGNGTQDLVLGTGMCWVATDYSYHRCYGIHAYNADGTSLPGFPKPLGPPGATPAVMPAVADLDGDGLKEIVFIDFVGNVLVWTIDGIPGPENAQWPMYRQNPAHTAALE